MDLVTYVDRVPTEIWLRCWTLCPTRHLRRLARVCRYFRTLCQPLLFQHQRVAAPEGVDHYNWMHSTQTLHFATLRITRLAASTHVSSVRSWFFRGNSRLDLVNSYLDIINIHIVQEIYLKLQRKFFTTLGIYQRVTTLRLYDLPVDAAFRHTLSSLKLLENLTLDYCEITSRTGHPLPLRSLSLSGNDRTGSNEPLQLVSPDNLHSLRMDGSLDTVSLLSNLPQHSFHNLLHLSIGLTDITADALIPLLNVCPRLNSINLKPAYGHFALPDGDELPPTAIPVLTSFSGPGKLAPSFVSNRPVEVVRLYAPLVGTDTQEHVAQEIISNLEVVSRSSAPLRSLHIVPRIPASPEIFSAIATFFPELRRLCTELHEPSRFWPPVALNDDFHAPETEEEDAGEVDDRTVDISDIDTLCYDSDDSDMSAEFAPSTKIAELPPTVLPGHMYTASGRIVPPETDRVYPTDSPDALPCLMDWICASRVPLPPHLEVLHFDQPEFRRSPVSISLREQHRAILDLERLIPSLKDVAFRKSDKRWTREGNMWIQRGKGARIISTSTPSQ
ncbi:hypothetical protein B0H10DRAFT_2434587 [Mycena sp. CBHHK59/15]|nr:hypothetical protein B0H10DRAFT_2434587 [Mycena sp. CBHHK59/15]